MMGNSSDVEQMPMNREWEADAAQTTSTGENGDISQVARVPLSLEAIMADTEKRFPRTMAYLSEH